MSKKISQLPQTASIPNDIDVLPIVNNGVTKKVTALNLANYVLTKMNDRELVITQIPITQNSIRINFPENRYSTTEPIVLCTVIGGVTNVNMSFPLESVVGIGEVHTHVILTFQSDVIGKKCNVWLTGGY